MADLGAGERGWLRIGAIEPTAARRLPPLLVPFCLRRPALRLTLQTGGTHDLSERVAAGELDLAICSPPHASADLTFEPLFAEPMALLAPAEHPLATREPLLATDLDGARLLATDPGCSYRESVERALLRHGAAVAPGIEIGSLGALTAAVQQGLGVAIVPLAAVDPPPTGLITRCVADLELAVPVGIARRRSAPPPSAALQALIAVLRGRLSTPSRSGALHSAYD
jgi:DNA-binding transcriptional LysR family regulator